MPMDDVAERVILECNSKSHRKIWDMSRARFRETDPLASGAFVCTQAKLSIKFHPKNGSSNGRTISLTITMPNGCDLRDLTSQEQMIGEKYLRRWKLLQDA